MSDCRYVFRSAIRVSGGSNCSPTRKPPVFAAQRKRLVFVLVAEIAVKHQIEIALQEVGVELNQPPRIDDRCPGIHPVAAVAAGDAIRLFARQIDRLES